MVGRSLKQFRIVALLGEGGMGAVYRAVDETLQREVALKVLVESLAQDEERRRRFLLEARSAAAVTHPNIATIYEIGEAEGLVFIAMELVPGGTLRDRLLAGLPHGEAVRIAREVARGLGRAHEKGIVHRDLKPENVMVTPEGGVKILDFGLAKLGAGQLHGGNVDPNAATQLTLEGRVLGTPGYMSPEQAEGKADLDARSDVFSFGALLFEMLVGVPPFQGDSAIAILVGVLHHEPPPLASLIPGISPDLAQVVARCLRKRREERFATGTEIVKALGGGASTPSMRGVSTPLAPLTPQPTAAELGATVASDHQHVLAANAIPTVPTAPKPRSSWSAAFVAVPLVLGSAALAVFFSTRPHDWASPRGGSSSSASSSSSSGAPPHPDGVRHGVAITEHSVPAGTNPDAAAHYRFALSRLRIGAIDPYVELERAVGLDPTLAPAQLRMTLYATAFGPQLTASERRTRFSKATALADSLEARDKALLPIAEAVSQDPIDFTVAATRARAAWEKSPNDAELGLLLFIYELRGNDKSRKDAKVTGRKVLDLDPLATRVYQLEAVQALNQQEFDEAASLVGECLKASPTASGCAMARVQIARDQGHCEDELSDAQTLVQLEPDSMRPYTALAQALDATGARIEAVKNALDQAEARRQDGVAKEPPGLGKLALALRTGDFTGAETALTAIEMALADSTSEQDHDSLAALRIALAEETGNRARALVIAEDFAKGARGWTPNAPLGVRTKVLYLLHEAGTMNDAAFEAARAKHLAEQYKLFGITGAERKDYWRVLTDARYAETTADAKVAMEGRAGLPAMSAFEYHEHATDYGRLLSLVGRIEPAITALESQTKRCESLPTALSVDLSKLDVILDYVHAQALLGQALEQKRDKDGACHAYRVVESRWKDAKPRSVTLEKVKGRLHTLACPTPR